MGICAEWWRPMAVVDFLILYFFFGGGGGFLSLFLFSISSCLSIVAWFKTWKNKRKRTLIRSNGWALRETKCWSISILDIPPSNPLLSFFFFFYTYTVNCFRRRRRRRRRHRWCPIQVSLFSCLVVSALLNENVDFSRLKFRSLFRSLNLSLFLITFLLPCFFFYSWQCALYADLCGFLYGGTVSVWPIIYRFAYFSQRSLRFAISANCAVDVIFGRFVLAFFFFFFFFYTQITESYTIKDSRELFYCPPGGRVC